MLDSPLGRLLCGLGITLVGFFGMGIIGSETLGLVFIATGLVTFIHQLVWDVLDYSFLDNKVGRIIKRVLFLGVSGAVLIEAFVLYIGQLAILDELNYVQISHASTLISATLVAILFCFLTFYFSGRKYAFTIQVEAAVIGLVIGLAGGAVTKYVGSALGIVFNLLLVAGLVFYVVVATRKKGFIYCEIYENSYDEEDSSISFPKFTKGSDNYKDYTPEQKEKTFLIDVEYNMKMTALKFRQSKSILYGVNLDTDVTSSTSGRNVTFTLDVKVSGGTFQNQAEVDHAISARDAYIKSLMDSIRRDAADRVIHNAKNIGCDSAIYISFDVNFRTA